KQSSFSWRRFFGYSAAGAVTTVGAVGAVASGVNHQLNASTYTSSLISQRLPERGVRMLARLFPHQQYKAMVETAKITGGLTAGLMTGVAVARWTMQDKDQEDIRKFRNRAGVISVASGAAGIWS